MFQPPLEELNWRRHRAHVALETNLARKGFVSLGDAEAIDAEDLLGEVQATIALRLNDLDVLAWLSARRPFGGSGVAFSRSHIAHDLYRRSPGGRERRIVNESLDRLSEARLTFRGYSPGSKRLTSFKEVQVLRAVERIDGGTTVATFAPWLAEHLEEGYVTYLHWNALRSLGGLAKRLWIYLEAENLSRNPRKGPAWLALGEKTWTALGLDYRKPNQARAALRAAAEKVEGVDSEYLLEIKRHGASGYKLEIHLAPLRPDESVVAETPVDPDDAPVEFLEPGDLAWVEPDAESVLVVWPAGEGPVLHRPECAIVGEQCEQGDDVLLILFSDLLAHTQWLLDQRLATPRRCPECRPPQPRFPMEEGELSSVAAPTTGAAA
jgi:hypothetical protein